METLNLNVNLENLTAEERDNLMKLVEKSQEKNSKVWKPNLGDKYFIVQDSGDAHNASWCNSAVDNKRFEIGSVFAAEEAAEEEAIRRRMLAKWKRLSIESGEEENPWDCKCLHYYALFDHKEKMLTVSSALYVHDNNIFFPYYQAIKAAIKELGEDNVKKYILGVKE